MLELRYGRNPRVEEHERKKRVESWGEVEKGPRPVLLHGGDTDEVDGFEFRLVVEEDYGVHDPGDDDQVLGTLTDSPTRRSSWKVDPDVARSKLYELGLRYYSYPGELPELYWNPMEEIEELERHWRRNGASKQVARELALAAEKSVMERRLAYGEHWHYVTVGVVVSRGGVELGSDYIGGVESDFMDNGYADEIIPELASVALDEAWKTIGELLEVTRES